MNRSTPLGELQTDEHERCLASTFIPPGDIDEEVSGLVRHRRVVAVDDWREREHVVVAVYDERKSVHSFEEMSVVNPLGGGQECPKLTWRLHVQGE